MGIISIINPSLLRGVDFMTGGFPSKYGDKMSSVFEMSLVDGNKEVYNVDANANLAGFGTMIDGPLPGNGTMIFSLTVVFKYLLERLALITVLFSTIKSTPDAISIISG